MHLRATSIRANVQRIAGRACAVALGHAAVGHAAVRLAALGIAAIGLAAAPAAAQNEQGASCAPLVERFNTAIDQGREFDAYRASEESLATPECTAFRMPMLRRLAAWRLNEAQTLMARGRPVEEYENALVTAETSQVLWQASATLAEVRFGERRFAEAAQAYDRAIEIVKSETLTPATPSPAEIQSLLDRAAQARLLAANEAPKPGREQTVKTAAAATGALGGVFSPLVRGIAPRAVPMPITFDYRSATLTPVGEYAARELLRAIMEQRPNKVRIIGHTDARGGADYNLKLSKQRAEAVADFLRKNGLAVPVETEGVGFNEPMKVGAASGLSQDDIFALNRRVEWRRE